MSNATTALERQLEASIAYEQAKKAGAIMERMTFEKYVELPGEHATSLKWMLKSPLHYKWFSEQPPQDKDSYRQGRAIHTAVLEPDRFIRDYVLFEDRRFGKKWDAFAEMHEGKTILKPEQYETALRCRDAARAHPEAGPLLSEAGKNEISIQWRHERTGLFVKSRLDRACSALVDIKSTNNPEKRAFDATAYRFGYPLQMSLYWRAAKAAGLGMLPVVIVAVQNVAPYDVAVYELDAEYLIHGEDQYESALDKVKECRESGKWPGTAPGRLQLQVPAWAAIEAEDEITFGGEAII